MDFTDTLELKLEKKKTKKKKKTLKGSSIGPALSVLPNGH